MSREQAAVITGSAGAIGQALVATFEAAGYRVIGIDKQPASDTRHIRADLDEFCVSAAYRESVVKEVRKQLADRELKVLVNNAAVQMLNRVEQITPDEWRTTLNVNLVAPFLLAQSLLADLEQTQGSIINIASVHAFATKPRFVCYATSKAALVGLTRSMAVDLGPRVRVNAICPAAIDTPMLADGFNGDASKLGALAGVHPIGRIAQPTELAEMALFLSSPKTGFVTGSAVTLDGGILARLHDPE